MKSTGLMVAVVGALALAACSSTSREIGPSNGAGAPTAPSQQETAPGNVEVTRVRVFVKDGRVQAFLNGNVGDGCTRLQPMTQSRTDNAITVNVTSIRQGEVCTMIMQLLNGYVPLNGTFEPGNYTVRANAVTTTFALTRDGSGQLAISPDPGPLPEGATYQ